MKKMKSNNMDQLQDCAKTGEKGMNRTEFAQEYSLENCGSDCGASNTTQKTKDCK